MIQAVLTDSQGLLLTNKALSGDHYKRPSSGRMSVSVVSLLKKLLVPPSISSKVSSVAIVFLLLGIIQHNALLSNDINIW